MVSSDFGKLEVMRHLISGDDCAIAGEATAAAAAPVAETFKKSRRFIKASPCWGFPIIGLVSCVIRQKRSTSPRGRVSPGLYHGSSGYQTRQRHGRAEPKSNADQAAAITLWS